MDALDFSGSPRHDACQNVTRWRQQDLFEHVVAAYREADAGTLENATLYDHVARAVGVDAGQVHEAVPIGKAADRHKPFMRAVRWCQQTMRSMGLLQRVEGVRSLWRLAEPTKDDLHCAASGVRLLAFSTDLGLAIWASHEDVTARIDRPIALVFTSPPYPLQKARRYGNPTASEFSAFIVKALSPIVPKLAPGGSVVLNVSNDIFLSGMPARSTYIERMVIAIEDSLGLFLMDRMPWINRAKPPGPTRWACVHRVQLRTAYEPLYWFTNDPKAAMARVDNRRVLLPHSDEHVRLMRGGGAGRSATYGDGAYTLRAHSFGRETPGKIPTNVLEYGHMCADTLAFRRCAKALGLPVHGAMMPTRLPAFLIEFLTLPGELVVDIFGGSGKTGLAAERLGRQWIVIERILEYLRTSAELFRSCDGFALHPAVGQVGAGLLE